MPKNLILTGFSGTGKTQVGRRIAEVLGWKFVDTDEKIVDSEGKSIPELFASEGESGFRKLEAMVLTEACSDVRLVISTGGGAASYSNNHQVMAESGFVVCLDATPEIIYERLSLGIGNNGGVGIRPLLASAGSYEDAIKNIKMLKGQRQTYYDMADCTVYSDGLNIEEVASQVMNAWQAHELGISKVSALEALDSSFVLDTDSSSYPVFVDWGMLGNIHNYFVKLGIAGPVFIITDSNVADIYVPIVQNALEKSGIQSQVFVVAAGESSKSLRTLQSIYGWLAEQHCERGNTIVALGGGVVGDLAGFAAATFLRGLSLVQVPTSLAGMVDAAIGGKTAVNLDVGKNLVGSFYQPRAILADLDCLRTLPQRELAAGWAEAIKHGLILDADLFGFFEEHYDSIIGLEMDVTAAAIRRSMLIKAKIVGSDEKETKGRRMILNYGHTIGHALESATNYSELLHGEAVAVGMRAAARISFEMGLLEASVVDRQARILDHFGLPDSCNQAEPASVLKAVKLDKKSSAKKIRWVLLEDCGSATISQDVPDELVSKVVQQICR
jgi:3-dehydroquinate synthase